MTKNDILTLAQRLREYNHNPHHINPVSDAFHGLIADSADALAQLAAIQGGMGEEPLVVATAILGGLFHGGSGPELGEIDIDVSMPALEALQCETVDSSDDVFMPLMTVAQHQRILAASVPAGCKVVPVESLRRWVTGLQLGIISQRSVVEELRAILEAKDE